MPPSRTKKKCAPEWDRELPDIPAPRSPYNIESARALVTVVEEALGKAFALRNEEKQKRSAILDTLFQQSGAAEPDSTRALRRPRGIRLEELEARYDNLLALLRQEIERQRHYEEQDKKAFLALKMEVTNYTAWIRSLLNNLAADSSETPFTLFATMRGEALRDAMYERKRA